MQFHPPEQAVSDNRSHDDFLAGLGAKDPVAEGEFDRRYRRRLCALVDREMGRRLRGREDPDDVVQSALRTFFRRFANGEFQLGHSDEPELWGLLKKITYRKLLKHAEYHDAGKRALRKETQPASGEPAEPDPSPAEAAAMADVIEAAVAGLEPPDPEIFRLRLEGHTIAEIAEHVGCKVGRVRYKLDGIGDRLRHLLGDEFDA